MARIGFALSGGGFRATLFHLGLVRFLRDAGVLPAITHITAVSGGSILAAHLVLNWDRYNGPPEEFDQAAAELLAFVRLDVRNRIARRFPLLLPVRLLRRLALRRGGRRFTRTGLLEQQYKKFLYGDTSLFQLPEHPQLHILATNLSEGRLCSFTRTGLLMQRRHAGKSSRFDRIRAGLATVPMAVTASSAFPGFFPPIELTGADVGVSDGEFGRQAFTDGGVFDNLGVRMFRLMERFWGASDLPLGRDDFIDLGAIVAALDAAAKASDDSPLKRLSQMLSSARVASAHPALGLPKPVAQPSEGFDSSVDIRAGRLLERLGSVISQQQLQCDPMFAIVKVDDPDAEALLQAARLEEQALDPLDQVWLNRRLLEAVFRQAGCRGCFRKPTGGLDGVLVSDVGKPFRVLGQARAGGLIRTALRASDILMDRVWQLEKETFEDTPGFVFAPSTACVEPDEDPTAPHPEVQLQAANIRTDMDRFSDLEISTLVKHGYCVARKACRSRPDLFGTNLPTSAPWDPTMPAQRGGKPLSGFAMATKAKPGSGLARGAAPAAREARTLQASAQRRIWSTLLDYRDWTSYIYVPLIIPILVLAPYFTIKAYERSQRMNLLVQSIVQNSRDFQEMSRLLDRGPPAHFTGVAPEEVSNLDVGNSTGFLILQDTQLIDMRRIDCRNPAHNLSTPGIYGYRRVRVVKQPEVGEAARMHIQLEPNSPKLSARFPTQVLEPVLRKARSTRAGQEHFLWDMVFDFTKVPVGEPVDGFVEYFSHEALQQRAGSGYSLDFVVQAHTAEKSLWLLMPAGKEYQSYCIVRYPLDKPAAVESVRPVADYMAGDYTILAFRLLELKAGYTYEVQWMYKD